MNLSDGPVGSFIVIGHFSTTELPQANQQPSKESCNGSVMTEAATITVKQLCEGSESILHTVTHSQNSKWQK